MKLLWLSYKQILHRPLGALLTLLLLALGVALIALLLHAKQGYQDRMNKTIKGIDMVIGAKGSPLQLILSSVYHADVPTGNIAWDEAKKFGKNPLVESSIPLAFGDSYEGVRVVGTTEKYIALYGGELKEGSIWSKDMDVVLGAQVAATKNLSLDETFLGAHGLLDGGETHDEHPFKVVGVLQETGTVLDDLILTSVHSVHHVHAHHAHVHEDITAMLIEFRSPIALMQLPRMVNEKTNMQAAVPRYELERLFKLFGVGSKALNGLGLLLVLVAVLSMFIGLYNGLKERIPELALMRAYGARRVQLITMVGFEGLLLGTVGGILGLVIARLTLGLLAANWQGARSFISTRTGILPEEVWILLGCMLISVLVACIPAFRTVRNNLDPING